MRLCRQTNRFILAAMAVFLAANLASSADPPDSVTFEYTVGLVEQPNDTSCWAAAAAMVIGWRDCVSVPAESMQTNEYLRKAFTRTLPLNGVPELARQTGLVAEEPQNYTLRGWAELLATYGPLWVGIVPRDQPLWERHVVVIIGIQTDGTEENTSFLIANPSRAETLNILGDDGEFDTYWQPFPWFVEEYEGIVRQQLEGRIPPGPTIYQVLHADPSEMCEESADEVRSCRRALAPIFGDL